jgi:hypothetical protein
MHLDMQKASRISQLDRIKTNVGVLVKFCGPWFVDWYFSINVPGTCISDPRPNENTQQQSECFSSKGIH